MAERVSPPLYRTCWIHETVVVYKCVSVSVSVSVYLVDIRSMQCNMDVVDYARCMQHAMQHGCGKLCAIYAACNATWMWWTMRDICSMQCNMDVVDYVDICSMQCSMDVVDYARYMQHAMLHGCGGLCAIYAA